MNEPYQFLDALSDEERKALTESIKERGVLAPVLVDDDGNILDGYHRAAICDELGIDYPTEVVPGLNEAEKVELAISLNLKRRHLTSDQKRQLVLRLREHGLSIRKIAKATGIPRSTVQDYAKPRPVKEVSEFGRERPIGHAWSVFTSTAERLKEYRASESLYWGTYAAYRTGTNYAQDDWTEDDYRLWMGMWIEAGYEAQHLFRTGKHRDWSLPKAMTKSQIEPYIVQQEKIDRMGAFIVGEFIEWTERHGLTENPAVEPPRFPQAADFDLECDCDWCDFIGDILPHGSDAETVALMAAGYMGLFFGFTVDAAA